MEDDEIYTTRGHIVPFNTRRCFPHTHHPVKIPDPQLGEGHEFSATVLAIDANGNVNLVYWDYELEGWFYLNITGLNDATVDDVPFNWIYIPEYLKRPDVKYESH